MRRREKNTTILIGGSRRAEWLRRTLGRRAEVTCGVGSHLRGLRRSLLLDPAPVTLLCISLDQATLKRYGKPLRSLLEDRQMFGGSIRVLGLLPDGCHSDAWELNCDVYVDSPDAAIEVMELLAAEMTTDRQTGAATNRFAAHRRTEIRHELRAATRGRCSRSERWNAGGDDSRFG